MDSQATPLERIKAYAGELDGPLRDEEYISQLVGLQEDELVQVVDHFSDVCSLPLLNICS